MLSKSTEVICSTWKINGDFKSTKRNMLKENHTLKEKSRILFGYLAVCLVWQKPISKGVLEEVNMLNVCGRVGVGWRSICTECNIRNSLRELYIM